MHTDRRHFLRHSAILTAGAALLPAWSSALAATRTLATPVPLTVADTEVLAWVARYTSKYRLQGGCILGKLNGSPNKFTQIVTHMTDPVKFAALLTQDSPLNASLVNGTKYGFEYSGTLFTIENSPLGLPSYVGPASWKHEAMQYDPVTRVLTDPLVATGTGTTLTTTIKLVSKTRTVAQNFQALVTGLIESALYKLTQDAAFNSFRRSVLANTVTSTSVAASINSILLQNLAVLSQVFPANSLSAILQSQIVATSLAKQFSITPAQLVARFTTLRSHVAATYSDESIWLSLLLPAQISPQTGDLTAAICLPNNSGFNAVLSLDALADARRLSNDPDFL